jgi:ubiquinone/menaquinone biosynthesis C-methylase UbiE
MGMIENKTMRFLTLFLLFVLNIYPFTFAEEEERFSFVVMGCMHMGLKDSITLDRVAGNIKKLKPDFVLCLGGMIDVMSDKPLESLWQEYDLFTKKLEVPVYDIYGTCKLLPLSIPSDKANLMEKCFIDRYKKRYYSFEHKKSLFICLDSDTLFSPNKKGEIDNEQFKFLDACLSKASQYDNIFVALNRSFWLDEDKDKWFKVIHPIIKNRVNSVFGAHQHELKARKIDGIYYISSGYPALTEPLLNNTAGFSYFLDVAVKKPRVSSVHVFQIQPIPLQYFDDSRNENKIDTDGSYAYIPAQSAFKSYILEAPERQLILDINRITEALNIQPGMNIVDIGAGSGLFTFAFAKEMQGTGKIFATDVDPAMIKYIENKTEELKYKNVFPTHVKSEGLDPFYQKHSFDLMFLSGVYDSILHPEDYFEALRPSLVKDRGRLYVIQFKSVSDFSEMEFGDFQDVIKILASKGEKFPVYQRLDKDIKSFLHTWKVGDIPPEIRIKILQNLNRMLYERFLWNDLSEYYALNAKSFSGLTACLAAFLDPLDVRLAEWLIISLDEKDIFNKEKKTITDTDKKDLYKLNRVLLADIFKTNKLYWVTTRRFCVGKDIIISVLEKAGYQFVTEYDFLPHHYFLEFKRKI